MKKQVWYKYYDDLEGICWLCNITPINIKKFHCHDIASKGGIDTLDNLFPACPTCNQNMGTKTLNEFIIELVKNKNKNKNKNNNANNSAHKIMKL